MVRVDYHRFDRPSGRALGRFRSAHLALTLIFAFCLLLPAIAAAKENSRVALVIGNSRYAQVPDLDNPKNDAEAIGLTLGRLGFDVTTLYDLDYRAMRTSLRDFGEVSAGAEVALIYYAGHGLEINKQNYLIPIDARLRTTRDVNFEAIKLDDLLVSMADASGIKVVFLDACRNNPFLASMKPISGTRAISRGLARVDPPSGMMVGFAAGEGMTAADGDGEHSPYATAILENLDTEGLEIGKFFRLITDNVKKSTGGEQEPFYYGSLPAEDIFLGKPPVIAMLEEPPKVPEVETGPVVESSATARNLGLLGAAQKHISVPIDREIVYYRFSVSGSERKISVDIDDASATLDVEVFLEDGTGVVLAQSDRAGGKPEGILAPASGGTYFLRVVQKDWATRLTSASLTLASVPVPTEEASAVVSTVTIFDRERDKADAKFLGYIVSSPTRKQSNYDSNVVYYFFLVKKETENVSINFSGKTEFTVYLENVNGKVLEYSPYAQSIKNISAVVPPGEYYLRFQGIAGAGIGNLAFGIWGREAIEKPAATTRSVAWDLVTIGAKPRSRSATIEHKPQYTQFEVSRKLETVSLIVSGLSGGDFNADIDIYLEDEAGNVLDKSANSGFKPEVIRTSLGRGTYFLKVQKKGTDLKPSWYSIVVSGFSKMREPLMGQFGYIVEKHGDYSVYRRGNECTMMTMARSVVPSLGWRSERPYFSIKVEKAGDNIWIHMDQATLEDGSDLYLPDSLKARIDGRTSIPVVFEGKWIKPLSPCNNDRNNICVDNGALRGFRRGQFVRLAGRVPGTNEEISFDYSLRGYTKAAQRINKLCGAKADWIWNQ